MRGYGEHLGAISGKATKNSHPHFNLCLLHPSLVSEVGDVPPAARGRIEEAPEVVDGDELRVATGPEVIKRNLVASLVECSCLRSIPAALSSKSYSTL